MASSLRCQAVLGCWAEFASPPPDDIIPLHVECFLESSDPLLLWNGGCLRFSGIGAVFHQAAASRGAVIVAVECESWWLVGPMLVGHHGSDTELWLSAHPARWYPFGFRQRHDALVAINHEMTLMPRPGYWRWYGRSQCVTERALYSRFLCECGLKAQALDNILARKS